MQKMHWALIQISYFCQFFVKGSAPKQILGGGGCDKSFCNNLKRQFIKKYKKCKKSNLINPTY